jgi:hypothetical protein
MPSSILLTSVSPTIRALPTRLLVLILIDGHCDLVHAMAAASFDAFSTMAFAKRAAFGQSVKAASIWKPCRD